MRGRHPVILKRVSPYALGSLFITLLSWLAACSHAFHHSEESMTTLFLDAKSDWANTGLFVRRGQRLFFETRGTWAVAPENERERWPDAGPEGHGKHPGERVHRQGDSKKELPGVPFGTLLGKINDAVFPIGCQKEVVIPANGRLYLVINDYPFYRHDNRGGLHITIMTQKTSKDW